MRDEIQEILHLQREYTPVNTEPMQRRGILVRRNLPAKIRERMAEISSHSRIDDFGVVGSDGVGRKTIIPWVRVHSKSRSPRPTSGWYAVYLFSGKGERAYLSLIQGTTSWDGGELKRQPEEKLASRVRWARHSLGLTNTPPEGWTYDMKLDGPSGGLGEGYELGSVVAAEYSVSAVPEDVQLVNHLTQAMTWLETLYRLEDDGISGPSDTAAEVADAQTAIEDMAVMRQGVLRSKPDFEVGQRPEPYAATTSVPTNGVTLLKARDEAYAQLTADEIFSELEQTAGPAIQWRVVELLTLRIMGAAH